MVLFRLRSQQFLRESTKVVISVFLYLALGLFVFGFDENVDSPVQIIHVLKLIALPMNFSNTL